MTTNETATIGKTVYTITNSGYESETFFYTLKHGKNTKSLFNMNCEWFIQNNNDSRSLPKYVTPIFSNVLRVA